MLKIYNTLTKKKEIFKSIRPDMVSLYVCGPTVYDHLHIGNLRPLIFFDMFKKYLEHLNFKVTYVVNITDIDDKIIEVAIKNRITEKMVANKYINAFFDILRKFNLNNINHFPQVTNFITHITKYIQKLIDHGYCYFNEQGIYFRSSLIDNYGQLSSQVISQLKKNSRKIINVAKEYHQDFILWKKTSLGIKYNSPWFDGRPGWHTECVVIIKECFQGILDIHGGGQDLKFPHHENELAQSWAYNHTLLANFFMHIGHVNFNDNKMSKSLGNVIWAKDLLQKFDPNVIKFLILSYHYHQPININYSLIRSFEQKYQKIKRIFQKNILVFRVNNIVCNKIDDWFLNEFHQYMDDDFNTPNVITLIETGLKYCSQKNNLIDLVIIQNTLIFIFEIFNINFSLKKVTDRILNIYYLWRSENQKQNFVKSDHYRSILLKEGFI